MDEQAVTPATKMVTLQDILNHYERTYLRLHRKRPLPLIKLLNRHLPPYGSTPATLTRAEAHSILATMNHVPASQRVWKTEMQAAFNHAMLTGLLPDGANPFALLKTRPFGIRQRVLSDSELQVLLPWLRTSGCKTACKTFQISGVISVQKLPPWVV